MASGIGLLLRPRRLSPVRVTPLRSGVTLPLRITELIFSALFVVSLCPNGGAQTDLRDKVTLMNGKEVRGRVLSPFGPERILLVQGGKRKRYPHVMVRDVHTVNDDLRTFFEYRKQHGSDPKRAWYLVEWAESKKLHGIARLQAFSIVLADPKHDKAHEFLGHQKRKSEWRWPVETRHRSLADFEKYHSKWSKSFELTGEHFRVKTNAGVARAVEMLFDLERLYLFWMDTFGEPLRMNEAVKPIDVHAWSSRFKFPKISAVQLPYYDVKNEHAATFFRADAKRPEQLFAVATQALIYATLVENKAIHARSHVCAWAEVGLGLWVESAFDGKPGQAVPLKKAHLDPLTASTVFRSRPRLNRVIHLHYELYYEFSKMTTIRWGATETLVHYLMSKKPDPKMRARFMTYLERVFRKGLGDSSTAFDKAMEQKVETLQPKFMRWLQVKGA